MVCVYKICIIVDKLSVVWLCIVFDASVNKSFYTNAHKEKQLRYTKLTSIILSKSSHTNKEDTHHTYTALLKHSVVSVVLLFHVLLLLVHVPLIVFLHYGLYVDLSVPLT